MTFRFTVHTLLHFLVFVYLRRRLLTFLLLTSLTYVTLLSVECRL